MRLSPACVLLAFGLVLGAAGSPARGEALPEIRHKVAIVYNIMSFVQWPDDGAARPAFDFCVTEGDELGAGLFALEGLPLHGRVIRVRAEAGARLAGCDALYLSPPGAAVMRQLGSRSVLTIAHTHGMVDQGAMVNLVQDGKRMGFDIGLGALRRARLSASAKLLRLARYVRED